MLYMRDRENSCFFEKRRPLRKFLFDFVWPKGCWGVANLKEWSSPKQSTQDNSCKHEKWCDVLLFFYDKGGQCEQLKNDLENRSKQVAKNSCLGFLGTDPWSIASWRWMKTVWTSSTQKTERKLFLISFSRQSCFDKRIIAASTHSSTFPCQMNPLSSRNQISKSEKVITTILKIILSSFSWGAASAAGGIILIIWLTNIS